MKRIILLISFIILSTMYAQVHTGGHINPSELEIVNLEGTVILVESVNNNLYYLDTNSDGQVNYRLNFGPYWYEPDSSSAVRPADGDYIKVSGGLMEISMMDEVTIIVYEINDQYWRDPFYAEWNSLGFHSHERGYHHGSSMGYGFGWNHDTLTTIEVSGTALVDTTFYMNHYYLDIDNDSVPDYFLNFGPFWYEPESEAVRPSDGQTITILGGSMTTSLELQMLMVYEIDGNVWRDSTSLGNHFGGGWLFSESDSSYMFHSPFDNDDRVSIGSGWGNGGSHGGGMNNFDSLFCQILEVYPENIPNSGNMNIMAGYEIQMYNHMGISQMNRGGMMGGHMNFNSPVSYQLHYSDTQLGFYNADEASIKVKYWDDENNSWIDINCELDKENNTVKFDSEVVSNYIVLTYSSTTDVKTTNNSVPNSFSLEQNYPNPFNPTTTINYTIAKSANVSLRIYNSLGALVETIVDQYQSPGEYSINFNAASYSSGVYFYKLNTPEKSITKSMVLVK